MSANLLERCTPGPLVVEHDGYPEEFALAVDEPVTHTTVSRLRCDPSDKEAVETVKADAHLHALAPDHALLLAALATGRACIHEGVTHSTVTIEGVINEHGTARFFYCEHDAFGCPALTPELRAALREALGFKP